MLLFEVRVEGRVGEVGLPAPTNEVSGGAIGLLPALPFFLRLELLRRTVVHLACEGRSEL